MLFRLLPFFAGFVLVLEAIVSAAAVAWARHDPGNVAWEVMLSLATVALLLVMLAIWLAFEEMKGTKDAKTPFFRIAFLSIASMVFACALSAGAVAGVYPGRAYTNRDDVLATGRAFCILQPVDNDKKRQCYQDVAGEHAYWSLTPRPLPKLWHDKERARVKALLAKRAADEAKAEQARVAEETRQRQIEYHASLKPDIWRDPETGCEYLVQRGEGSQTYLERKDANGRQICRKGHDLEIG